MKRKNDDVTPYVPSEDDKRVALSTVFYEIQQLWFSSQLRSEQQFVTNAFIESALLHVRVLMDFYERTSRSVSNKSENDDVLSSDYGFPPRSLNIPYKYRERLNKDLVHLSYARNTRLTPDKKPWPLEEFLPPLIDRSVEFIDSLDEATFARWKEYLSSNGSCYERISCLLGNC